MDFQVIAVGTVGPRAELLHECTWVYAVLVSVLCVAVGALLHAWLASACSAELLDVLAAWADVEG